MLKYILGMIVAVFVLASVHAAEITVAWDMPTHNMDGTVLTDLGGAKIHWGTNSYEYTKVVDVGMVTEFTITNLTNGVTYYINGTAYSTSGAESDFAMEVAKTFDGDLNQPVRLKLFTKKE